MREPARVVDIAPFRRKKRSGGGGDDFIGQAIAKGLSRKTIQALFKKFEAPVNERAFRDRALLHVALDTGLRVSELLRLSFNDCFETDEGESVFLVKVKSSSKGKSRKHAVLITEEALQHVREYHRYARIKSVRFFHSLPLRRLGNKRTELTRRGLYNIIASWKVKTRGNRPAHPHALRHSVGKLISDEYGHATAAQVLGHTNIRTTRSYYSDPYASVTIVGNWRKVIDQTGDNK